MKTITIILGIAAIGGAAYYSYKKKSVGQFLTSNVKVIDGTLDFNDVVAYFKSKNLKKGSDVPFIARDGAMGQFVKKTHKRFPEGKVGYLTIVLGVYNEVDEKVTHGQILYVKELDERIKEVFGNEELIVLS
ncbi:MAG: hypothetical protein IJT39_05750 [Bacteroidales bacterium]|nr:hypothetical protein [Bacteroidales bacterium]